MPRSDPPRAGAPSGAPYLVVFVVGLVIGAFALLVALRALESRAGWQQRYPRAVMHLHQAHMAQLDAAVAAQRCTHDDVGPHLRSLRMLSDDLEPAFPEWRDHRGFAMHADTLRHTLDAASAADLADCDATAATVRSIDADCRACHQDTRR